MSRRWAWWTSGSLLLLALLASGAWRLSREIPDRLRKAEEAVREEAARYGLGISFKNLRFHLLYPRVSLDDLEVRDERAGTHLLRAGSVDVSLSPGHLLRGDSPVSRIRIRNFTILAGEENRPVIERLRKMERKGPTPEILFLDGRARIGPVGPLKRWESRIQELRIREVRFLGTRISLHAEEASGEIALPGAKSANWPLDSLEAEMFLNEGVLRLRKFRASGPSMALKASGNIDLSRHSGEAQFSGAADLARWISAGAPGAPWIKQFAENGKFDFSVALSGSLEDPTGSGKLVLRECRLHENIPVEMELAVSASKRKIKMESLKGKILGGTIAGNGAYDLGTGEGEGKFSLARISYANSLPEGLGPGWRPAGSGDAEISLAADRNKVRAILSWKNPAGLERVEGTSRAVAIRLPLSATATADYFYGGEIRIVALNLHAGDAVLSGSGEIVPSRRTIRLGGDFSLPRGKAADYGWAYPISWGSIAGEWGAQGAVAKPRVTMRLEAHELHARALPPVPVLIKIDGDLSDAVHFVVDVPASVAKATATGTVTAPLSAESRALEATVAVRDIDFSDGSRWITGVLASLGKDATGAARYTAGLSGSGKADFRLTVGSRAYAVSGSLRSADLRLKGARFREVSMEGAWNHSEAVETWKAHADGKMGDGTFRLDGSGKNGSTEIAGALDMLDIGQVVPLIVPWTGPRIEGVAGVRFAAGIRDDGWVLDRASISAQRVAIDNAVLTGVSGEGSIGSAGGRFVLSVQSPGINVTANVHRGGEWPTAVTLIANDVPTGFLLSAWGRKGTVSGGKWRVEAEGEVKAASLLSERVVLADAVSDLRFSVSGGSPSVSEVAFGEVTVSGRKEGDILTGEASSRSPDTRLAFSMILREPYRFRVDGPFSFRSAENGKGKDEAKARFDVSGRAEIAGALRAIEGTSGLLKIDEFHLRNRAIELSGKEISAQIAADGVRWTGGTVLAAGNPLNVSGKVSWKGDLDARLEGKIPAAVVRLATDVFDRLDGSLRLDIRMTGKWDDPAVAGNGRLEGGTLSFRGYAQVFEEMRAEGVISREKIVFEHFEGRSGGGYIDGRGELPLRFDAHQPLYFSVDFFDMRFPYPDDFQPVLQGHAELVGPYDDFLVTGEVEVQSARYTRTLRPEKVLVDFRKRLTDVTARREKSDFRVRLDVSAVADGTIKIKNNLADADVKGEFRVVGDASRVIVLGAFDVLEGFMEYQGNKYDLRRVGVEFQDPRRNNPILDVRAETKKGNYTVIVTVTGSLEKYEVELASEPPLSKNDIVSLLSFGVTTQALAGSEGTLGAAAASSIVLGPYKGKVEEGLRGTGILDKFSIESSYSTSTKSFEPKLVVGKSIGDRLSVTVSTSVGTTSESSATAEFKLLENVYLQGAWESATTTQQGDLGADVKIRYRYREFKDFLRGRE